MQRLAQILLLAGGVLLATWVYAPAAPSPSPLPARAAADAVDQAAPLVAEMAAQVERMRSRLEGPQSFPPPERNPFTFGARHEVVPARPRLPVAAPEEPPPPPAPVLPRLLAVVSNDVDGVTSLQAVFAVNNGVQAFKTGDAIGSYLIRSITAEVVELVEPLTNTVHRLTLR